MIYETWRISYQSSEQAARAAYAECVRLRARLEAAEKERDELRSKIEAMEKQEPVAWCATDETETVIEALGMNKSRRFDTAPYLTPGAQPAPSVPEKIKRVESGFKGMFLREAQAYKQGWNECRAAMIAAAREAKP